MWARKSRNKDVSPLADTRPTHFTVAQIFEFATFIFLSPPGESERKTAVKTQASAAVVASELIFLPARRSFETRSLGLLL